jgi:hypothetical protein
VVVELIDHGNVDRLIGEAFGRSKTAKVGANDRRACDGLLSLSLLSASPICPDEQG